MTITEFLTARYDEDEADARAAVGTAVFQRQTGRWVHRNVELSDYTSLIVFAVAEGPEGARTQVADLTAAWEGPERAVHITRHDPARVLADIAAKRAIVALHKPVEDRNWKSGVSHGYLWCGSCGSLDDSPEPYPCRTVLAMVQPYAEHPDFDEAWRV